MTTPAAIAATLPRRWTVIAERERGGSPVADLPPWQPVPRAPLTIAEAHQLVDVGALLMANRYEPARVVLLIKPRQVPPPAERPILQAGAFRHV
jgi:hypothetical protein